MKESWTQWKKLKEKLQTFLQQCTFLVSEELVKIYLDNLKHLHFSN